MVEVKDLTRRKQQRVKCRKAPFAHAAARSARACNVVLRDGLQRSCKQEVNLESACLRSYQLPEVNPLD